MRLAWWRHKAKSWRDLSVSVPDKSSIPNLIFQDWNQIQLYPKNAVPVFFGHYWMAYPPKIESKNAFVACRNSDCEISKATAFSICESCEVVDEISDVKLSKYLSNFKYKKGMKFKRFNLEFFGLCKKCKKNNKPNTI